MSVPIYKDNGGLVSAVSTTVDVTFMGTINADDILVCQVIAGVAGTWSTPSGWTKIGEVQYTGVSSLTFAVFWKRATGAERYQFQNGAIKSETVTIKEIIKSKFQFQNGAIKRILKKQNGKQNINFNSRMVRLKEEY